MKLSHKLRSTVIIIGMLILASATSGQVASEKPASVLYSSAVRNPQTKISVKNSSITPARDPQKLQSAQLIPNAGTPKLKRDPNSPFNPRKVSEMEGKRNLASNALVPRQKYDQRRKPQKPVAPSPGQATDPAP